MDRKIEIKINVLSADPARLKRRIQGRARRSERELIQRLQKGQVKAATREAR